MTALLYCWRQYSNTIHTQMRLCMQLPCHTLVSTPPLGDYFSLWTLFCPLKGCHIIYYIYLLDHTKQNNFSIGIILRKCFCDQILLFKTCHGAPQCSFYSLSQQPPNVSSASEKKTLHGWWSAGCTIEGITLPPMYKRMVVGLSYWAHQVDVFRAN